MNGILVGLIVIIMAILPSSVCAERHKVGGGYDLFLNSLGANFSQLFGSFWVECSAIFVGVVIISTVVALMTSLGIRQWHLACLAQFFCLATIVPIGLMSLRHAGLQ